MHQGKFVMRVQHVIIMVYQNRTYALIRQTHTRNYRNITFQLTLTVDKTRIRNFHLSLCVCDVIQTIGFETIVPCSCVCAIVFPKERNFHEQIETQL